MLLASSWAAPSLALGLILIGDALLYAVLPSNADVFGVSTAGVGILLASNRAIRLIAMPRIAQALARFGGRLVMLVAVVLGVASTLGYATLSGAAALWPMRLAWGLAYGAGFLCMLTAAAQAPEAVGRRIGLARGLSKLPALAALALTPWALRFIEVRTLFLIAAAIALLAVPVAMRIEPGRARATQRVFGWPDRRDRLFAVVALSVDGVVVTLAGPLLAEGGDAIAAASLALASFRVADLVLAPVAGHLCDRLHPKPVLVVASIGVFIGLVLMSSGIAPWAFVALVVFRPAITPAIYADARLSGSELCVVRIGRLATWRDVGAALGPLFALTALSQVGTVVLFACLGALLCFAISQWVSPTTHP